MARRCLGIALAASLGALLSNALLGLANGVEPDSLLPGIAFSGLPYFAYCGLIFARRRYPDVALLITMFTVVVAGLSSLGYWMEAWPYIQAKREGTELLNCAGPIVPFLIFVLQWSLVGFLWLASRGNPSIEAGHDRAHTKEITYINDLE